MNQKEIRKPKPLAEEIAENMRKWSLSDYRRYKELMKRLEVFKGLISIPKDKGTT